MRITICKFGMAVFFGLLLFSCNEKKSALSETKDTLIHSFIAHAGGAIDGIHYTNSLEALELSYSKGCRLLELDILETTDGKFVAFHDWVGFKMHSDYSGKIDSLPISEKEFLSYPTIFKKYTSLDMDKINKWFETHSDAILVTDKINKPAAFSKAFRFKDRLIMELFTWKAVEEAIQEGIVAMPSENLMGTDMEIVQKLSELNIEYLALSRRSLSWRKKVLKELKTNGVKIYVYHVNNDEGKDERYVWENEMEHVYGMYADDLSLLEELLQKTNN